MANGNPPQYKNDEELRQAILEGFSQRFATRYEPRGVEEIGDKQPKLSDYDKDIQNLMSNERFDRDWETLRG